MCKKAIPLSILTGGLPQLINIPWNNDREANGAKDGVFS